MNMPTTSHKCIFFWKEETLEDPMELFHLLNSIDNKIKFTIEMGESIPFLDILFTLVENSIMETDIYYKPTDTIMYSSGASTRIKLSPIYPSHSRSRFALLFQRRTLENSVSGNWRVFCWRKSRHWFWYFPRFSLGPGRASEVSNIFAGWCILDHAFCLHK